MVKYVVRSDPTYWIYYIEELKNLIEQKTILQGLPIYGQIKIMQSTMAQEHLLFISSMNQL